MIILPSWVITNTRDLPSRDWGVRVVADRIQDLAPNPVLRERYPADAVWEAEGHVLAPGFVNAHTHLYGVLTHGIPLQHVPSGFYPFLLDFWWPQVEDRLTVEMICAAAALNCARMLQTGVTCFYDCLEAPQALPGCLEAQARIVEQSGLRAVLSFEATERISPANGRLGLAENAEFIRDHLTPPGLISGLMCFHTSFTCSPDLIREAFGLGRDLGVPVHMHLSEGSFEPEYTMEHFGLRPVHYYASLGLLSPSMLASQCVHVDASEIETMAAHGVRAVHMPLSNCEVGGGIAPVPEMIGRGITLGLGSDGYVEDFFDIMRGAFLLHKASHRDPRVMPAHQVWHLATEGGARALGLDRVGRLTPGWQADLQLIKADLPTPLTEYNLYEQLLLYRSAADVRAVMVAGRLLLQDGLVLGADLDALRARAHAAVKCLWAQSQESVA